MMPTLGLAVAATTGPLAPTAGPPLGTTAGTPPGLLLGPTAGPALGAGLGADLDVPVDATLGWLGPGWLELMASSPRVGPEDECRKTRAPSVTGGALGSCYVAVVSKHAPEAPRNWAASCSA